MVWISHTRLFGFYTKDHDMFKEGVAGWLLPTSVYSTTVISHFGHITDQLKFHGLTESLLMCGLPSPLQHVIAYTCLQSQQTNQAHSCVPTIALNLH